MTGDDQEECTLPMALDLCIDQPVFDAVGDGMIIHVLLIRTDCVIIATVV